MIMDYRNLKSEKLWTHENMDYIMGTQITILLDNFVINFPFTFLADIKM